MSIIHIFCLVQESSYDESTDAAIPSSSKWLRRAESSRSSDNKTSYASQSCTWSSETNGLVSDYSSLSHGCGRGSVSGCNDLVNLTWTWPI